MDKQTDIRCVQLQKCVCTLPRCHWSSCSCLALDNTWSEKHRKTTQLNSRHQTETR